MDEFSLERVLFQLEEKVEVIDLVANQKIMRPRLFFYTKKPEPLDPGACANIPHLYARDFEFVHPYWTIEHQGFISLVAGIGGFGLRLAFELSLKKGEPMTREATIAWTERFIRSDESLYNIIGISFLEISPDLSKTLEVSLEVKRERSAIRTTGTIYFLEGLYVGQSTYSIHEGEKEGIKEARMVFERTVP